MIILIGSEKGGCGKTTIAVNMAAIRAQTRRVALVNTDKQDSAVHWARIRFMDNVAPAVPCFGVYGADTLLEQIRNLAEQYDDIVIDAGGRDSTDLRVGMTEADVIITPTMPSLFDIYTLSTMDHLVGEARKINPKLDARFLINGASTHALAGDAAEIREHLEDMECYSVLSSVVKHRKAYRMCARYGMAAPELKSQDEKATAEMKNLAEEIWS